jgi:hypothetical protein
MSVLTPPLLRSESETNYRAPVEEAENCSQPGFMQFSKYKEILRQCESVLAFFCHPVQKRSIPKESI